MDRIHSKYNPEVTRRKAESCLNGITAGELASWKEHPCTKSLKLSMEAVLDQIVEGITRGGFTYNNMETCALEQSRAVGMAEAINSTMDYIEDMLENTLRENTYEEAGYNA